MTSASRALSSGRPGLDWPPIDREDYGFSIISFCCTGVPIEFGVPLALGTGQVPLGDLSGTPLDILRLACCQLGLTPAEALVATTVNAAFASGLGEDVGSLEPGKRADLLILNVPSYARLPYHSSADPIRAVIKDGWVVVEEGRRVA